MLVVIMAFVLFIANLLFAINVHGSFWGWVVGLVLCFAIPLILVSKLKQKPSRKKKPETLAVRDESLETRIAKLNSLLANGLISEAEHSARKGELIREI